MSIKKIALTLLFFTLLVFVACKPQPSCTDELQNQNENGVDCGGPCIPCGTCSDGVKNQNETAIDCGGVCSKCLTCSDGIQNQGETGVDCGGPCAPCKISYPSTSMFGINILRQQAYDTSTVLTASLGMSVGFAAHLPKNTSLKIKITTLQKTPPSYWTLVQNGTWIENKNSPGTTADYYTNGPIQADMAFSNFSSNLIYLKLDYFEDADTLAEFSKIVKWKIK